MLAALALGPAYFNAGGEPPLHDAVREALRKTHIIVESIKVYTSTLEKADRTSIYKESDGGGGGISNMSVHVGILLPKEFKSRLTTNTFQGRREWIMKGGR